MLPWPPPSREPDSTSPLSVRPETLGPKQASSWRRALKFRPSWALFASRASPRARCRRTAALAASSPIVLACAMGRGPRP
eukprot:167929-Pyramimonas_sp.AAC.1